jgi:hypothetical protein
MHVPWLMCPTLLFYSIYMPDNFTCQGESAAIIHAFIGFICNFNLKLLAEILTEIEFMAVRSLIASFLILVSNVCQQMKKLILQILVTRTHCPYMHDLQRLRYCSGMINYD